MSEKKKIRTALVAAFPHGIPILAGFLFMGTAYGVYMQSAGFSPWYPIVMSVVVFAGSMQFVCVNLLLSAFHPLSALVLTLMVNARHIFYGISMLDKYKGVGKKKWYLILGMCDESFSINCTAEIPSGVDKGWFMFFITFLNHIYWVVGTIIGAVLGSLIVLPTQGLDFVMTALFVTLFTEQWLKESEHHSSLIGLGISFLCLVVLGGKNFMIPAMLLIICTLTFFRKSFEKEGVPT